MDDINRIRPRHGYKYTKYKMCLNMMMVMCCKQYLSNIWSWIHEKVKLSNTEAELKNVLLMKKDRVIGLRSALSVLQFIMIGP